MDARIEPFGLLGLAVGDAHILRNAGAVVTDDVLRSLALSHWLLGTREALVIGHTECGVLGLDEDGLRARMGAPAAGVAFHRFDDVEENVREGVRRIAASPLLPAAFRASGHVYDVRSGRLLPVVQD